MAFVDIGDTIREVYGCKKKGLASRYANVKRLNA